MDAQFLRGVHPSEPAPGYKKARQRRAGTWSKQAARAKQNTSGSNQSDRKGEEGEEGKESKDSRESRERKERNLKPLGAGGNLGV
jgi:hypothetical protein